MDELSIKLQIAYETAPLCLEEPFPIFTWQLHSEKRKVLQKSFCLTLLYGGHTYWTTGSQNREELCYTYDGPALQPECCYTARLQIQDCYARTAETELSFRTGLMAESFDAPQWCGAKWIGTGTRSLWAPALSVFDLSCDIQIAEGSDTAELIFGANDPRLMDRDKNLWGIEQPRFHSWMSLRLNLQPLKLGAPARLELYRVGYTAGETDTRTVPLHTLEIPAAIVSAQNAHQWHTLEIRSVYGEVDVLLDGRQIRKVPEHPSPFDNGSLNLNPAGRGGDYTCYPNLCDIGVRLLPGNAASFRKLTVRNYRQPCNVLFSCWQEATLFTAEEARPFFRIFDPSSHGLPMLRCAFETSQVTRAWLAITARGVYEVAINGTKIGGDFLAPGLSQYDKSHFYQVYELTDQITAGENVLAAELAEGWWSGAFSFRGSNWNYWGDVQSMLCKLTLEHPDGTITTLVSTPETFTACDEGPDRYASIFQGQVYDAYYEADTEGWKRPGFDGAWNAAVEIPLNSETAAIGQEAESKEPTAPMDFHQVRPLGQMDTGIHAVQTMTALTCTEPHPGVFVYDFGQNIAGIPSVTLPGGFPGQEVTFRYAELLYPAMEEYGRNQNMLMVENLRGALVTDTVYLGNHEITFCPQFTYHGFRYLEITGLDAPLPCGQVQVLALSSVAELTADYHCSDPAVNHLFENICWSLQDNFFSVPTDCPQRNERMGWSGDLSVFSATAVSLCNADSFLRRHLQAMRDQQQKNGCFPDIAPGPNGFGGILWGSAGITVPWNLYRQYGDTQILAAHYNSMNAYIRYLLQHVDEKTGLQTAGELGDWLGPQNTATENNLLWMSYFAWDIHIMAETAAILNHAEDADFYDYLYQAVTHRFNEVFLDPESHKTVYSSEDAAYGNRMFFEPIDRSKPLPPKEPCGSYRMHTQTSYSVPLGMGILAAEHQHEAGQHLAHLCTEEITGDDGVVRPANSLMTGFIGTAWILPALSLAGRDDAAYRMLLSRTYPSWLYPVTQGATTIWERLDSYTTDHGFGGHNSMNSFNHYSFGAVGQWLLNNSLGISHESAGWQQFILCPTPDEDRALTMAEGWMDTVCGRIESRWELLQRSTRYMITVPAGTSCILQLKGRPQAVITESGMRASEAEGVTVLGYNGTHHQFWLDSGSYVFEVSLY